MQEQKIVCSPRMHRLISLAGPMVLLGLLAHDARAQRADPDPFFGEIPLVLTASRLAQSPLDAPAPVTVIDREMISASGFNEIHDLLRLVPGFLVADHPDGPPTVASHGLGRCGEQGRGEQPPFLFLGHTDVVYADAAEWRVPPFAGVVRDGVGDPPHDDAEEGAEDELVASAAPHSSTPR